MCTANEVFTGYQTICKDECADYETRIATLSELLRNGVKEPSKITFDSEPANPFLKLSSRYAK